MLKTKVEPATRFHREAWLSAALEVLAKEGQAKLRVDNIAHQLGVTKGSFYHHFKDRDDFVKKLLDYWSRAFTDNVIAEVSALEASPQERFLHVNQMVEGEDLARYDIAFRSWAAQEPSVAKGVKKVDLKRYKFIRSLFAEMGFEGDELEDRVRIWLVFISAENSVYLPELSEDKNKTINRRHVFFTKPRSRTPAKGARQKLSRKRK